MLQEPIAFSQIWYSQDIEYILQYSFLIEFLHINVVHNALEYHLMNERYEYHLYQSIVLEL